MTTTRDRRTPTDALDTRDGVRIDLVLPEVVKVFPNFREVSHYALLAVDHRLSHSRVLVVPNQATVR